MGLPNIVIDFKELANTAVNRSGRGRVALVVKDATKPAATREYNAFDEVLAEDYTEDNLAIIKDMFIEGPSKVFVVTIGAEATFPDAEAALDKLRINWLCFADQTQTGVVEYIKKRNGKNPACMVKAIVYGTEGADNQHITNFTTESVIKKGGTAVEGYKYVGRMAGTAAAIPMTETLTYKVLNDLEGTSEPKDPNADIDAGKLLLINDYGEVRIARGVNSLQTTTNDSLKKIAVVEAMDLIREDIFNTFKNTYCGKFKNNLDNQKVFIAAVNNYFKNLAEEGILDDEFENVARIDVETQRKKWIEAGHEEARGWSDKEVEKKTFGSYIYLTGNIKILDGIEDINFNIFMN